MEAISFTYKKIKLLSIILIFSSCAHDNFYNSNACTSRTQSFHNLYLGGAYFWGGLITQQGECSLLRSLKIEMGGIYSAQKQSLDFALVAGGGSEIDIFAETIGCHRDSFPLFKQELLKNKDKIFNDKKSNRQIMLGVYAMIKDNEELNKLCWK